MDLTSFSPSSALLTIVVLALAPFVAVMVTSFTKIVVVLSLLRNALGLQQVPPNVVINGLAVILSMLGASPSTVPSDAQKLSTTAILSAFAPPPGRKNDAV